MKNDLLIGVIEVGVGIFLASPADEAIITTASGGTGAVLAPVQAPATAVIGGLFILDGMRRVFSAL